MVSQSAVDVDNVFFDYPNGHEVLKGLSCQIKYGEKVALIGPNGAGKSTFMSLLNGVLMPSKGQVSIANMEVIKENLVNIRRKVGIVFQDPDDQLFCPTVFDDVAFGPINLGLSKDDINSRVEKALSLVNLSGFKNRVSFHLSFGERKRLALATVLSYQPDILVFDEPSTNMDPLSRRNLIEWLQSSKKTILLCTHDLDIVLEVCSKCLLLADGKIVADGLSSDILYDRELLKANSLELPLVLQTHELLQDILRTDDMDEEHRSIISNFLHTHTHVHGPDGHHHAHVHAHNHKQPHKQERVGSQHAHNEEPHSHDMHKHTSFPHFHKEN